MAKKEKYMALADFQTLWDNKIKPAVALKTDLDGYLGTVTQQQFNAIFN